MTRAEEAAKRLLNKIYSKDPKFSVGFFHTKDILTVCEYVLRKENAVGRSTTTKEK